MWHHFCRGLRPDEPAAPTHANPPERAKPQCLGIPIFGVNSRIIDPDTLREAACATAKPDDIIAWAREHRVACKMPRIVEFADALPGGGSGKVMWRLLQEKEPNPV